jgi:hypothetical protein
MTSAVGPVPDPAVCPTLSVPEAGAFCGLGRSASYVAAERGEIPTLVFNGRSVRVPTAKLRQLLGLDPAPENDEPTAPVFPIRDVSPADLPARARLVRGGGAPEPPATRP